MTPQTSESPNSQIVEIRYLKSFVIYVLLATIISMASGIVVGMLLGFILGIAGFDLKIIQIICGIAGFIVGTVISFFVFRWVIQTQILPQVSRSDSKMPGDNQQ